MSTNHKDPDDLSHFHSRPHQENQNNAFLLHELRENLRHPFRYSGCALGAAAALATSISGYSLLGQGGGQEAGNAAVDTPLPTVSSEPFSPEPTPTPVAPTPELQKYPNALFASEAAWSQDYTKLPNGTDVTKEWRVFVGPAPANGEAQYYTNNPANIYVEEGVLKIRAREEAVNGYTYTSARIETLGKQDFMYGKIEVSAKIPFGVGTWPAIWLLPSENKYTGQPIPPRSNPYALNGEMDILEATGSQPGVIYGIGHSLVNPVNGAYPGVYYSTVTVPDANTAFHTYALEWTPNNLTFLVDGVAYYSVDKRDSYDYRQWPYDQKYYLVVNLALGGSWAGRETGRFPPDGIDKSALPAEMQIESINYFPYVPSQ